MAITFENLRFLLPKLTFNHDNIYFCYNTLVMYVFYVGCSVTIAGNSFDVIFMNGHLLSSQVSVIKAKLHEITGMPAGKQKLQLGVRKPMKI